MHKELSQKPKLGTGRNIKNMRQRSATNLENQIETTNYTGRPADGGVKKKKY